MVQCCLKHPHSCLRTLERYSITEVLTGTLSYKRKDSIKKLFDNLQSFRGDNDERAVCERLDELDLKSMTLKFEELEDGLNKFLNNYPEFLQDKQPHDLVNLAGNYATW